MRRRILPLMLGLMMALPVGAPVSAPATDVGAGCGQGPGSAPIQEAHCKFLFRGSLRVNASATDPGGSSRDMSLRVWIHEYNDHQRLGPVAGHETSLIVECSTTGKGFIACANDWPTGDEIDVIHPLLTQEVNLSCHVEANIAGTTARARVTYSCASGRGF